MAVSASDHSCVSMASSIASSAARTEPRAKVRTGLLRIRRFWLWRRYLMAAALLATTTPLSQSASSYQRIRECLGHFCTAVFASSSAHWALRNPPYSVIPALVAGISPMRALTCVLNASRLPPHQVRDRLRRSAAMTESVLFQRSRRGAGSGDGQTPLAGHCTCAMHLSLQFATVHV